MLATRSAEAPVPTRSCLFAEDAGGIGQRWVEVPAFARGALVRATSC